jgi:hypothetical protein
MSTAEKLAAVLSGNIDAVKRCGPVLKVVGDVARCGICAEPGKHLIGGDLVAVEAVVAAWVADERDVLAQWRQFLKTRDPALEPYLIDGLAAGFPPGIARPRGKVLTLAFQYEGGKGAFRNLAPADFEITDAEIDELKWAWRGRHSKIERCWKVVNQTAIDVVRQGPGTEIQCGKLTLRCESRHGVQFLHIDRPSGCSLAYPFARIVVNAKGKPAVGFMDNAGGKWAKDSTYGGKFFENIVSGIARDLIAAAMFRVEAAGYPVVLHVHDELVCEVADGFGSVEEFKALVEQVPGWAEGLPVGAKVRNGWRFAEAAVPVEHVAGVFEALRPKETKARTPRPKKAKQPRPEEGDNKNETGDDETGDDETEDDGYHTKRERTGGNLLATYIYKDHLGRPHLKVEKRSPPPGKRRPQFPQYHWAGSAWAPGKPAGPKIPYRLPELLAAQIKHPTTSVFVPEGEKDADTLAALGLTATTNSEGARKGSWAPELNRWFHGVPRVFIPEDNDDQGRKFAREKARALASIVPDVRIVSFPDVPAGEDVTYWLKTLGHTSAELKERCLAAPRWNSGELESVRASSIDMEDFEWLWPCRFALGKIGIIAGLPDEGKGQVLMYLIARCTNPALSFPNEEGKAPQGNVILLTAEDDLPDTVVPRLRAAGADPSRVEIVKMVRDHDEKTGEPRQRMLSLVRDLDKLRAKIAEVGNVVLIVIDPISAYLGIGEIDSFRDADVRAVLGPLKELAGEMQAAVVALMHFNKKTDVLNMMLRICNSIAFAAASRHAFGVIDDPDNKRKLFVRGKNNLAEKDDRALAFYFNVREVGVSKRTGKTITAPFIIWEEGYVDVTATEALAAVNESKSPGARERAKRFLLKALAKGPRPATEIEEEAEQEGIAQRTLMRAKAALGVESRRIAAKDGGKDRWEWLLPEQTDKGGSSE